MLVVSATGEMGHLFIKDLIVIYLFFIIFIPLKKGKEILLARIWWWQKRKMN
jgi:hypothetical protein